MNLSLSLCVHPQANALVKLIFHSHATLCPLYVQGHPMLMAIRSGGQQC